MDRIDDVLFPAADWWVLALIMGLILPSRISAPPRRIVMIAAVMVFAAGINYRYVMGLALLAISPAAVRIGVARRMTAGSGSRRSSIPGRIRSAMASR